MHSPVPGQGAERYLSVALIHDPGLLAGSVAIKMTVEVTENGRKVRREVSPSTSATAISSPASTPPVARQPRGSQSALRAAHASADNLLRSDLV